jgi:outer membrane protein TolC
MFQLRQGLPLIAALALAVVPGGSWAEGRPDPLGHLVREALRVNLGLEQQRLAERRSAAEVHEAVGLLLPAVNLESRYSRLSGGLNVGDLLNPAYQALNQLTGSPSFPTDIDITLPQRHESRLRLTQPLFNETIRSNLALARARHQGQRMQLAAAARQLAAEAQIAWLQEASARRLAEIYEASLALVAENQRVAERLLEAGRATPEAVHRARADRAELEQQLDEARERRAAAARELNRMLQRPLDQSIETLPDSVFDLPLEIDAEQAVARALAGREELRQGEAGVRAAEAGRRVATAAFMPDAALALDYGYAGADLALRDDQDFWSASVVVSWSLFNGGRDPARRAAAGYEARRAQAARRDLAERVAVEARNAHQSAVVARAAIVTAEARLEAARRTFTLVRRRFEEGAASSFELIDARTGLTNAELNRVLTGYRYAIRWVDLERAAALRDLSLEKGAQP